MGPTAFVADVAAAAHTFVPRLDDALSLTGDAGHHLARVRRLRPGEVVTAADGHGAWRAYTVAETGRAGVRLTATAPVAQEPELVPRVVVAFAVTKGRKPDLVVEKVTELGADAVMPLRTRRSVARWSGPRAEAARARLRRVAHEAAAQCRRAHLPEVGGPLELEALVGRPGLVVADREGAPAEQLRDPPGGEWVLVVGPEGGLDPEERAGLGAVPTLGVGPFVLRAETAAVAALATLASRRRPRSALA